MPRADRAGGEADETALAGQTAKGFPAGWQQAGDTWIASNAGGTPMFLTAENSAQLEAVLNGCLSLVGCKL